MLNQYLHSILIAIDQLFNTLLGGYEDETLSSRCGRAYAHPTRRWFVPILYHLINIIMLDKDHCDNALEQLDAELMDNREAWHWYT